MAAQGVSQQVSQHRADLLMQTERALRRPLLAFFRRRVADADEAEDLVQEVFVRLARHADLVQVRKLESYVFSIATNLLRDEARRTSRRRSLECEIDAAMQDARSFHMFAEEIEPERVLVAKRELTEVSNALMTLSERTRNIFVLHRLERMRQRDIAGLLGISVSAVEKHIIKANVLLATLLTHDDD